MKPNDESISGGRASADVSYEKEEERAGGSPTLADA